MILIALLIAKLTLRGGFIQERTLFRKKTDSLKLPVHLSL